MSETPVLDLLSDESRWTQGTVARNKDGEAVNFLDPGACQWCILGAIHKVHSDSNSIEKARARLRESLGDPLLAKFNDGASHEQVVELLGKAGV